MQPAKPVGGLPPRPSWHDRKSLVELRAPLFCNAVMTGLGQISSLKRCPLHDRFSSESGGPSAISLCRRSATSGCEQSQQGIRLFDDLVGVGEQRGWNFEAECFRYDACSTIKHAYGLAKCCR